MLSSNLCCRFETVPHCEKKRSTSESETFSPRIEDLLNKLSGGGSLRSLLLQLLKKMLVAYKDRLKKESRQIEFYRQLRILNPRNLSDMPRAMDQYPLLGLSDVPEIAEQWSLYIRCNVVDINGPTALQEWWQSRAPSPFQEGVLFLITQPTSGVVVLHSSLSSINLSYKKHAVP